MSLQPSTYTLNSKPVSRLFKAARKSVALFFLIISMFGIGGCSAFFPGVYKIDIQQGNQLKDENVQQLRLGMSESQVVYLLGSPTIQDPFHAHRWDYIYRLKEGNGAVRQRHVKIEFKDGYVTHISPGEWKDQKG